MRKETFDFDVAIIGGGTAGYAAARTSAAEGLRTVVIDGGAEVGGLCILRGCMPTKSLLYAAEAIHFAGRLHTWGILIGNVRFDFGQVMARKNAFIEDLATSRRDDLTAGTFKFHRGKARFIDPHTVEVEKVFRSEGIEVFTNTKIIGMLRGDQGKTVWFEHGGTARSVTAEELLLAIGRDPNTASLDLDKVGVATEHGRIWQTSTCGPAHRISMLPGIALALMPSFTSLLDRVRVPPTTSCILMRCGKWTTDYCSR